MGKTWLEKPSLICERSQIPRAAKLTFFLECMHELNPHWLKVQKQNKRNRVEVLDMGVCNGEATLSAVPSHPHQDSKLLIPLRHKVILFDVFQNAWDGQSLDFFFLTNFQPSVQDFLYPSAPSYPFPENMKNWGKMSPYCPLLSWPMFTCRIYLLLWICSWWSWNWKPYWWPPPPEGESCLGKNPPLTEDSRFSLCLVAVIRFTNEWLHQRDYKSFQLSWLHLIY